MQEPAFVKVANPFKDTFHVSFDLLFCEPQTFSFEIFDEINQILNSKLHYYV